MINVGLLISATKTIIIATIDAGTTTISSRIVKSGFFCHMPLTSSMNCANSLFDSSLGKIWLSTLFQASLSLSLLIAGKINTRPLITHTYPLNSIMEAFEMQARPEIAVKVMIKP